MKTSSVQGETSENVTLVNAQLLSSDIYPPTYSATETDTASFKLPNFNILSAVESHSLRMAARLNAASATEEERHNLLRQRKGLLDKKLDGRITPSELNKLEYVRWSLDRIEDARYGSALDALEDSVSKYENFISEIHSLSSQLLSHAGKKK